MPEQDDASAEHARRHIVLMSATYAFVVCVACALPRWMHDPHPRLADLAIQALPVASASAFLAGLCVGLPSLCPWPRFTLIGGVTFPAMHIALIVALSNLLTSRQSALMELLPPQRLISEWIEPRRFLTAFCFEVLFFGVIVGVQWARGEGARRATEC